MAIGSLSSVTISDLLSSYASNSASDRAWSAVGSALESGNLTTAANAFKVYEQLNSSITSGTSTLAQSMSSLADALTTGSLTDALTAYSSAESALSSDPAQSIKAATEAASTSSQWIEDTLNLSSVFTSSSSSLSDLMSNLLNTAYGSPSASSSSDAVTNILASSYGQSLASSDAVSNILASVYTGSSANDVSSISALLASAISKKTTSGSSS